MPRGHDVDDGLATLSEYECLQCGDIVEAESHPGACDECGGDYQNRAKSLE